MRTLIIFSLFLSTFIQGQIPRRFWIHKANVTADTNAIIKNRVKSISAYYIDYYFDSIPVKKHYATWELEISGSEILRSRTKFIDSSAFYFSWLINFPKITYRKKKIIETKQPTPGDTRKLVMTHFLDGNKRITDSKFQYLSSKYEDCYSLLDKIKYEYNEKGLLTSAKYLNDWLTVDKNFNHLNVFFEYEYAP